MKILQVIHGFLPQFRGGTELYLLELARELRAQGHDVEIVTGTTDTADRARIDPYEHDGFRVWKLTLDHVYGEHWTRSISPAAAELFGEVLRRTRPDVVHVQHWYRLTRNLVETCFRRGIPAVCTLHDMWTSCPRVFRIREESFCTRPLGRESCIDCVPRFPWMDDGVTADQIDLFRDEFVNEIALAHRVIVPSEAHGAAVQQFNGLDGDRFVVMPHGTIADIERSWPAEKSTGGRQGKIRCGMWSHLFHMKGAHLILEALQELRARDRFEVHIFGRVVEPHYKERLEAAAEGLDVTWHGAFEPADVAKQPLDFAIIPSLCSESFSFVLDEAFKLGLPVVGARRGALADRIGSAGTTFEPENATDLAVVFKKILKDRRILERWRRSIPELTAMSWHAREVIRVYQQVIAEAPEADLVPDLTLPERRARHLADLVSHHEQLMFGYLGHIKRETGRGDHYEGVVKDMIEEQHEFGRKLNELRDRKEVLDGLVDAKTKLVDFLAREVADLRQTLEQLTAETPEVDLSQTAPPEVPEHVPGLGSAATVRRVNRAMIEGFLRGLEETLGRAERERLEAAAADAGHQQRVLNTVAGMVDTFRKAMVKVHDPKPVWRDTSFGLAKALRDHDLPNMGRLGDAMNRNTQIIEDFVAKVEELHRAAAAGDQLPGKDSLIAGLAKVVEHMRQALVVVFEEDPTTPAAPEVGDVEEHAPGLGDLASVVEVNTELITNLVKEIRILKGLEERAEALEE